MNDELAFNSKTDLGLLILLLGFAAVCFWVIAELWTGLVARGWLVAAAVGIPLGLGILLPLWLVVSLRYFLSAETLRVRCGPWRWRIPIRDISAVESTGSARAGPALSFDRLRIAYGGGRSIMIAPEPRTEFMRQLEHRRANSAAS
jgi:hypothetical protein